MSSSGPPKVAIVTGCSKGGIGYNLCEELATQGCTVYATARRLETLTDLTTIDAKGTIHILTLDVTKDEDVKRVVKTVFDAEGRIDILINNAGVICIGPILDITDERLQRTFDTNVYGAMRMARAVIPIMAKRKQGLVVNVGSIVGELPTPWNGVYCASKAALHSLTEVLRMECSPFGIKVQILAPGSVRSNLATNQEQTYRIALGSLYVPYVNQIMRRMHISQTAGSLDTREFARLAVKEMLQTNPKRIVFLGGNTMLFTILRWIPRSVALWLIWKSFSKTL